MPNKAAAVAVATPCCPAPVSAIETVLSEALGEQCLPENVVDLVAAGVVEIFALEEHARSPGVGGEPGHLGEG